MSKQATATARTRRPAAGSDPIAVIDLGSNSIRLVVFDRLHRVPLPFFNERVLCGLGRGLQQSKRLNPEGVSLALANIERFVRVARGLDVGEIAILATAAVRDAEDGPPFKVEIERRTGLEVTIVDGGLEARYSGMGVISGIPDADGIMGDLGGGSLELVEIDKGKLGRQATLPLGPLRLLEDGGSALREIDNHLATVDWLAGMKGRIFYPVGGAWRTVARTHMIQCDYPLRVIHEYAMERKAAGRMARLLAQQDRRSISQIPRVPQRRVDTLPLAALLMDRILDIGEPTHLVFSANGLREGYLFDRLPAAEQALDPLLTSTRELGNERNRTGDQSDMLAAWTDPLFPGEPAGERRVRQAACCLSDVAWRRHPDYRAFGAYERIIHWPFIGVDHPGRAYMAIASYCRYGGDVDDAEVSAAVKLLSPQRLHDARVLGRALRLVYVMTAGAPGLLGLTELSMNDQGVPQIRFAEGEEALFGDLPRRRFEALVRAVEERDQSRRAA